MIRTPEGSLLPREKNILTPVREMAAGIVLIALSSMSMLVSCGEYIQSERDLAQWTNRPGTEVSFQNPGGYDPALRSKLEPNDLTRSSDNAGDKVLYGAAALIIGFGVSARGSLRFALQKRN